MRKMGSEKYKLKWSKYETNILTAFHGLLESETLSDVTLFCEGQTFKAHRLVLAACSTHFESLFSHAPINAPTNNQFFVILDGTRADDLQILLHFMYRGEAYLHHDRINSVLKTAEVLQVKGLSEGPRNIEINNQNMHMAAASTSSRSWSPINSGGVPISPPLMRKKRERDDSPPTRSPIPEHSSPNYYPREQFPMYRLPTFAGRPVEAVAAAAAAAAAASSGSNNLPSSSSPFNHKASPSPCGGGERYSKMIRGGSASPHRPPSVSKREEEDDHYVRSSPMIRPSSNKAEDYEDVPPPPRGMGNSSSPQPPVSGLSKHQSFPSDSTTTELNSGPSGLLSRAYKERLRRESEHCEPESNTNNDDLTHQTKFPDFRNSREEISRLNDITPPRNPSGLNDEDVRTAANNLETFRRLAQQHARTLPIPVTLAQGFSASDYVRLASHVRDPENGTGTKLRCPFCERTYGYETNLRAHIRQRHQGIRVSCPYCPRTFTRNNTVRRHVAREHRHLSRNIPTRFTSTRIPPDPISAQQMAAVASATSLLQPPSPNTSGKVKSNLICSKYQKWSSTDIKK
uniref:Uncharacterized protein n=1 Tax=Lepeophtheirus salmonis TaxID=72036 RepID=A0A0K2UK63_LEPSM